MFMAASTKLRIIGRHFSAGGVPVGAIGAIATTKLTKLTLFSMILYNSDNSIRDMRTFCHPLFCHSSVMNILHLSYSSEPVMI